MGGGHFSWGNYSWDGDVSLPQNIYKPYQDLCEASYIIKETHIDSAVLRSFGTDRHTHIHTHTHREIHKHPVTFYKRINNNKL